MTPTSILANSNMGQSLSNLSNISNAGNSSSNNLPNISNMELNSLFTQMSEIRENNKTLEQKLFGSQQETIDFKAPSIFKAPPLYQVATPSPSGFASTSSSSWYSFAPPPDLAISVWKSTPQRGKNVLVECNDKFVQLLGYPIEVLRNGFVTNKLIPNGNGSSFDQQDKGEWPKRTQMVTANGLKMSLSPSIVYRTMKASIGLYIFYLSMVHPILPLHHLPHRLLHLPRLLRYHWDLLITNPTTETETGMATSEQVMVKVHTPTELFK